MKIPPKKPHFLKPILPGFKEKFKIPEGFLKYLKGLDHIDRAILKRTGKKWLVKLNGYRLEDGWKKFAEELNLQLGDLLVFRHEGDMEFEVSIFDSSCCEKQCGTEGKALTPEETSEKYEFEEKPNTSIKLSGKVSYHTEAATHRRFGCSHFVFTIKPYCLRYGILYVPKDFACANGLIANKKRDLIIKDETKRSWNLRITSGKTQVYIGDGCRKFIADNCLKKGDRIMFEVVTDGETPIWKFHVVTDAETLMRKFHEKPRPNIKKAGKRFSNVEATYKKMQLIHPHFICTIRPYCLSKYCLCIPKQFAQENRLNDRKRVIIMRDGRRSWRFRLFTSGKNTFIGSGWREFCLTNCFKEGDILMFEIVSNGETPIFKFHDLRGSPFLQPDVKKKNLDAERISDKDVRLITSDVTTPESQAAADANPHFISTIKPYTLRYPVLYLPMAFAKSNGLLDRHQLILVDENQRAWSMLLGQIGKNHFGIKRGWREFVKTNDFQVGDTYKFELSNNGTIPVIHFHCKYKAVGDGKGN